MRTVLKILPVISQLIGFPLEGWYAFVLLGNLTFTSSPLVSRAVELRLKNAGEGHDLTPRGREIYGLREAKPWRIGLAKD